MTPVRMRLAIAGIVAIALITGAGIWLTAKPSVPPASSKATSNATPFAEASPMPTARPFIAPGEMATPTRTPVAAGKWSPAVIATVTATVFSGSERVVPFAERPGRAPAPTLTKPARLEQRGTETVLLDSADALLLSESTTSSNRVGPSLSPDGRRFVYSDNRSPDDAPVLLIYDVTTKSVRPVALPRSGGRPGGDAVQLRYDFRLEWSPSSRFARVAYHTPTGPDPSRTERLMLVLDTETATVRSFPDNCGGGILVPYWAPDADRMIVPDGCQDGPKRAVLNAATGSVVPVPRANSYEVGAGGITAGETSGLTRLFDPAGREIRAFEGGELDEPGMPSGVQSMMTAEGPQFAAPPVLDHPCLGALVYLPSDGATARCIPPRGTGRARAVSWSPDGAVLAIVEDSPVRDAGQRLTAVDVTIRIVDVRAGREVAAVTGILPATYSFQYIPMWDANSARVSVSTYTFVP